MHAQDAEDSEMEEEEDSQADGFVVDDGYLSEGEGGPIDNDDFGAEVEGMMQNRKGQLFAVRHCNGHFCPRQHPKLYDA